MIIGEMKRKRVRMKIGCGVKEIEKKENGFQLKMEEGIEV